MLSTATIQSTLKTKACLLVLYTQIVFEMKLLYASGYSELTGLHVHVQIINAPKHANIRRMGYNCTHITTLSRLFHSTTIRTSILQFETTLGTKQLQIDLWIQTNASSNPDKNLTPFFSHTCTNNRNYFVLKVWKFWKSSLRIRRLNDKSSAN